MNKKNDLYYANEWRSLSRRLADVARFWFERKERAKFHKIAGKAIECRKESNHFFKKAIKAL